MRRTLKTIPTALVLTIALMLTLAPSVPVSAAENCQFLFGFKTVHDLIPDIVGECTSEELHNPENGDGLQITTRGLLVWRKSDNNTAFTDGVTSWIYGPLGLQSRANSERFPWEVAATATSATPAAPRAIGTPLQVLPEQALLTLNDVGRKIEVAYFDRGSEAWGSWAEVRYSRADEMLDQGAGPLKIANRIYIARDQGNAQYIYADEVTKQTRFPEASTEVWGTFRNAAVISLTTPTDAIDSREACNNDCYGASFNHTLHERTVVLSGNVVIVLYYWGRERYATPEQTSAWLSVNLARLR